MPTLQALNIPDSRFPIPCSRFPIPDSLFPSKMAINNYSEIIQTLIREQAELHKSGYVPIETIVDIERHHYLLLQVGWIKCDSLDRNRQMTGDCPKVG
ncbi:MAG: XisI protein [Moorea sp. SIO2I5]|nr:XisI protein [Moorena sp. SIO2I5]